MAAGGLFTVWRRIVRGKPVLFFEEGGEVLAAATVRWEKWLSLLDELGFERRNNGVWVTDSSTLFLEALVFYSVAHTVRRADVLQRLRLIVESLEVLELRFWANAFAREYRRLGRRGLYRPARSFKILYGLVR